MVDFVVRKLDKPKTTRSFVARPVDPPQKVDALTGGIAERLIDNTLALPEFVARAGVGGANVLRGVAGADPILRQPGENILPIPSGRQVLSGADTLLGMFTGNTDSLQGANDNRQRIAEQNPLSAATGEALGDAGTILTGRVPLGSRTAGAFDDIAPRIQSFFNSGTVTPGARKAVDDLIKSDAAGSIFRGLGRAAETGIEGATLAVLQDSDPISTAGYSAGAQAGTSILQALNPLAAKSKSGALAKLGVEAGLVFTAIQALKSASPGGEDSIIASGESAFNKVLAGVALGALGSAFGRRAGAENFPILSQTLATIPRGAMVSVIKDLNEAEPQVQAQAETLLQQLSADPESFTPSDRKRLQEALESGDFISAVKELNPLDEAINQGAKEMRRGRNRRR